MDRLLGLLRLMRPRQWVKNSFVLAPLVFAGAFVDRYAVQQALLAMVLFCVASSAVYIVNDIKDIERDRCHPKKSRARPLAAGVVSIPAALGLLATLYCLLIWGWFVQPAVVLVISGYVALNLAYSFVLKNQPVLDIFTVAFGFVLRVYAGAQSLAVPVSSWMFVTTLCLALYLAAIKRRQELGQRGSEGAQARGHAPAAPTPGRGRCGARHHHPCHAFHRHQMVTHRPPLSAPAQSSGLLPWHHRRPHCHHWT